MVNFRKGNLLYQNFKRLRGSGNRKIVVGSAILGYQKKKGKPSQRVGRFFKFGKTSASKESKWKHRGLLHRASESWKTSEKVICGLKKWKGEYFIRNKYPQLDRKRVGYGMA